MTLILCWLVFPSVLALLSLGCGLLLERASAAPIPRALLVPVGFAVMVVVSQFPTLYGTTAGLTVPLVISLAALGLAAAYPWRRRTIDVWAAGAAAAVFAVFAAPVVLSGEATFAGYIKLDDTATFLALVDRALEHGRDVTGLAPSSYEATVALNLPYYPLGSLLPVGIGAAIVGQDPAWVFQPYLAFLAALLGLCLYQLAGALVPSRRARATAAFFAAQPALLYGFALWGGVKELAAAPLIALVAVLAGDVFRSEVANRSLLPLAVAGAALLSVLSVGGAIWLLLPALAVLARLAHTRQFQPLAWTAGAFGLFVLPAVAVGHYLLSADTNEPLRDEGELGNLFAPLSVLQLAGVWPVGDFRGRPDEMELTYALIFVVVVLGVAGLAWTMARRAWGVALYVGAAVGAALGFQLFGSPWVAAKALAVGAPAVLLAAALGAAALLPRGRRVEAAALGLVMAAGVAWSNVLAYREVNLAPRNQLAELEEIGERFRGRGPALMTEYQPYGVRHFLRRLDPEGASELRRRLIPLRDGSMLEKGTTADLDAFQLGAILTYRTIVLRRSPLASRPPASYELVWASRFYEVWERPEGVERITDHLPLGTDGAPTAIPRCGEIRRLISSPGGQIIAAPARTAVVVLPPAQGFPGDTRRWDDGLVVPTSGSYELWLGGAFRGQLRALVDGRLVAAARHHLSYAGQFVSLGRVTLSAGRHSVRLVYEQDARPGSGGTAWPVGSLVVSRTLAVRPVAVTPRSARGLCRRSLDWVELNS